MKTRTTLALALATCATAACATSDDTATSPKLDIRHTGNAIDGSFADHAGSIEFHLHKSGDRVEVEIETARGFKLVESITANGVETASLLETFHVIDDVSKVRFTVDAIRDFTAMPELDLIRDLPRALAARGIDISEYVNASPALGDILCPTRASADETTQSDNLDSDRN